MSVITKENSATESPYTQEELKQIGNAIGLLDTKIKHLQNEIKIGKETVDKGKKTVFGKAIQDAFSYAFGLNLDDIKKAAEEKYKKDKHELKRTEIFRASIIDNPEKLLAVSEFYDLITSQDHAKPKVNY